MDSNKTDTPTVLVIDDSEIDREAMLETLERGGFRCAGLPSPIGATREVRRLDAKLVVIDQNMPLMDGSKLATLFRDNPAFKGVRLVLVSGNDASKMGEIARQAKADAFVSKREMHSQLVPTVRRLLRLTP